VPKSTYCIEEWLPARARLQGLQGQTAGPAGKKVEETMVNNIAQ